MKSDLHLHRRVTSTIQNIGGDGLKTLAAWLKVLGDPASIEMMVKVA
jgi:hypothetical protein